MQFPHLRSRSGESLDQVQLSGMLLSCVIGIFPNERHRKQPVTVDLCLYLSTRKAAGTASIHDTIDYAAAVKEVSFILEQCEFQLIESAVETLCRFFLATYATTHNLPQLEAVLVRISKPSALTHGIVPSVQILRERDSAPLAVGEHRIIDIDSKRRLEVQSILSGASVTIGPDVQIAKAVLPIGRFQNANNPVKPRTAITWEGEGSVELVNTQSTHQIVLSVI
jgi:dihydroneopterin aldolase